MNDKPKYEQINWVSANQLIERQTAQIMRDFRTSKPRPRNKACGFKKNLTTFAVPR